ncbi:MAG: hypothetical protein PVF73_11230 [Bacteroidales bacterium]|jgi:hypothetical protein
MRHLYLIAIFASIFLSCNDDKENSESPENISCLSDYITTPCELVDKTEIAGYAGANADDIEVEIPDEIPLDEVTQYSRIFCEYRWPSKRISIMTTQLGERELETEIPLDNVVNIGDIELIEEDDLLTLSGHTETYAEYFHRVRIGDDNPNSERLDGVGDMASLNIIEAMNHSNYRMANVWVLHKNVNFNIVVDVSDSDEEDVALAKKIAVAVLEVCAE